MTHRPEIDGLRGIAVLFVLLYHAQLGCPGGYVGVDIFFVISGYLICRLLEDEIQGGSFSYAAFWTRRIRRLFPALIVVIAVVEALGLWLLTPEDLAQLGWATMSQPLLAVNVVFWRTVKAGYFGQMPEVRPTLHTWSLAVEEQFYLFCPILLWWLRDVERNRKALLLLLLAFASWLLSAGLTATKPVFCYFLLPTRIFEILLGGLLWYRPIPTSSVARRDGYCWLGFALVAVSVWGLSDSTVFPGWVAVVPCLGTALLLRNAQLGTASCRLLRWTFLTGIGQISYSLYLWHWPLIAFWRYAQLPWGYPERLLLAIASLVLGWLSTKLIENPIRRRSIFSQDRTLLKVALISSILCLASGAALVFSGGLPQRFSPSSLAYFEAKDDRGFIRELTLEEIAHHQFVEFGSKPAQAGAKLFVWGDSHAMAVLAGLDSLCTEQNIAGLAATHSGSPPFVCQRRDQPGFDAQEQRQRCQVVYDFLKAHPPGGVLLVARWDYYLEEDYAPGLTRTFRFLDSIHVPYWVMLEVPRQPFDVPRVLGRLNHLGRNLEDVGVSDKVHWSATADFRVWLGKAGLRPSQLLDPASLLVNEHGVCRTNLAGQSLYYDVDHLSASGSRLLAPLFLPILEKLVPKGFP